MPRARSADPCQPSLGGMASAGSWCRSRPAGESPLPCPHPQLVSTKERKSLGRGFGESHPGLSGESIITDCLRQGLQPRREMAPRCWVARMNTSPGRQQRAGGTPAPAGRDGACRPPARSWARSHRDPRWGQSQLHPPWGAPCSPAAPTQGRQSPFGWHQHPGGQSWVLPAPHHPQGCTGSLPAQREPRGVGSPASAPGGGDGGESYK